MSLSSSEEDLFIPIQYSSDDEINIDDIIARSYPRSKITKEIETIKITIEKKKKKAPKKKAIRKSPEDQFLEKAIKESNRISKQNVSPVEETKDQPKIKKGSLWKKLQEKKLQSRVPVPKEQKGQDLGQIYLEKKAGMKKSFIENSQKRVNLVPKLSTETEKQIEGIISKGQNEIKDYVYEKMNKTVNSMTFEIIDYSLSTDKHILDFANLLEFERNLPHKQVNTSAWKNMSELMYKNFKHRTISLDGVLITDPIPFYQEMLKQYVGQGMVNAFTDYFNRGVFDKFKPEETPLVFFSCQKDYADIFPEIDMIVSLKHLIAHRLAPNNAMSFNPYGTKLLGFAIFWSFSFDFNLFGGFFRSDDGRIQLYWIVYKRLTENMDEILLTKEMKDLRDLERLRKPETPISIVEEKQETPNMEIVDRYINGLTVSEVSPEQKVKLISSMQHIMRNGEAIQSY